MKKSHWKAQHKWLGLILSFFLLMFCLSGLVLNHPSLFAGINVSRSLLPPRYHYKNWNSGLLRGSVSWHGKVLIYGNNGIWATDSMARSFTNFNRGLPQGVDGQLIRGMVVTADGKLFAASQYKLYCYDSKKGWIDTGLDNGDERLNDIATQGKDSLIITGRSHIFVARAPYRHFETITLQKGTDDDGRVSLFSTLWQLHSGALFGLVGKLIVDAIAIILIILIVTGLLFWFLPKVHYHGPAIFQSFKLHNKLGRTTIVLTLFIAISGWMLRPPGLIAIASGRIPAIPFSSMASKNPWNDQLRALRYDSTCNDYILSTSKGFYTLRSLRDQLVPVTNQPPVSVMGINVLHERGDGRWIVGSFSGLYLWDRKDNYIADVFTDDQEGNMIPISAHAITGLCTDFKGGDVIVDYNDGTTRFPMPTFMETLPMSLRLVALEIHTGRIYPFGFSGMLYIFLVGIAIVWCLWSGYKRRKR